jgi:4-amino-4-deoxy-L-arabinose transferase-like glycosyltransferase
VVKALAAIVVAGAAVRFATLDAQSFWQDEGLTVLLLREDLAGMWRGVLDIEATPPLYHLLAWGWTRATGVGEVGVRSLSALLGTVTIVVAYGIGARLGAMRAGLAAALLVAFNPFLVWFSQEARAYALLSLLTALATLLWLRALSDESRRSALGWGVAGALALLTHYFAAFLLVPQACVLLWRTRAALLGCVPIALAALALVPVALEQRDAPVSWVSLDPFKTRAFDVPKHFLAGPFGSPVDAAVAVCGLLVAAGAVLALARPAPGVRALAGTLVAAAGLPFVLALAGADYVLDRYFVPTLVPLLALSAAGFATLRRGVLASGAVAALFAAFTVTWIADPELHRENWREVAERVRAAGPGTVVVTSVEGVWPLRAYLDEPPEVSGPTPARTVFAVSPWRFGKPRPPTPALPGFEPAERDELPTITLLRYEGGGEVAPPPGAGSAAFIVR